jgi:hypothetical protein
MKKILGVLLCLAFIPGAVLAQDTTLYDMSDNMLNLTEATLSCITAGHECSEAEALALKADAEQGVQDIVSLLISGNMSRMMLSGDQAVALQARLRGLESLLVHTSGFLQGACNVGIALFEKAIIFIFPNPYWVITIAMGIFYLPIGCLLMLTCPFWWL